MKTGGDDAWQEWKRNDAPGSRPLAVGQEPVVRLRSGGQKRENTARQVWSSAGQPIQAFPRFQFTLC